MWYPIVSEDVEISLEKRKAARPAHLERLYELRDQGRLLVAGPNPAIDSEDPGPAGFSGSLVIAEFDTQQIFIEILLIFHKPFSQDHQNQNHKHQHKL